MNTNSLESQQMNSGIASTARLKQILKDRRRRPAEQMRRNGGRPSNSSSQGDPESEPQFFSEDKEDMPLRNELEKTFEKMSCPRKNQRPEPKQQGKRIDIVI
jgi:hypothetical protein